MAHNATWTANHSPKAAKTTIIGAILALLVLLWPGFAAAQTYTLSPSPFLLIENNSGIIVNGGCIWTFLAGGTTPATTYTTSTGTANANPIIADSAGRFTAYLPPGVSFKFVYENIPCSASSHGAVLKTADNIAAVPPSGVNVDITGTAGEGLTAGDLAYLSDGSGSLNQGQWYKADADLYYGSIHPMLGFVPTTIASGGSGSFRISGAVTQAGLAVGSTYYVSGTAGGVTATAPANVRSVGQALSATSLAINIGNPWILDVGQDLRAMGGRLTLTTAVPVTTTDVTAGATLFYTPYNGNRVSLFDGSRWKSYSFSEVSLAITCTASKPYDVWLYDNVGTLTLETLVWTNDTTRATALALQNGVYVKTGATTRRYLGSFYCDSGANTTTDSVLKRNLWNYYNRRLRPMRVTVGGGTHTYTSTTLRQYNNDAANQIEFMLGVSEDTVEAFATASARNATAGVAFLTSIGLDSTSAHATGVIVTPGSSGATFLDGTSAKYTALVAAGRHLLAWLEYSVATDVTTWDVLSSINNPGGLFGTVWS